MAADDPVAGTPRVKEILDYIRTHPEHPKFATYAIFSQYLYTFRNYKPERRITEVEFSEAKQFGKLEEFREWWSNPDHFYGFKKNSLTPGENFILHISHYCQINYPQ